MIVANKIDLRDQLRAEGKRVIETEDGAKLAKVCLSKRSFDHRSLFSTRNIKLYLLKQVRKTGRIPMKH